jgi:hypothetical protein
MRGAYRNTGLGHTAVERVLQKIAEVSGCRRFDLYVTLPVEALTGPGGELQKEMWLTFFYHRGFRPASSPPQRTRLTRGDGQQSAVYLVGSFQ